MAAGGDQGVQGGNGYLGGAGEDELHGWLTASQAGLSGRNVTVTSNAQVYGPGARGAYAQSRAPRTCSYAP
ncbi:hypothetical protein JCM13580A_55210 [Streptomyces drozdowiczii]